MHQQLSVMSRASTSVYNVGTISSSLSLYYQEENNSLEEATHQKGVGVARHNASVITLSGRPLPSKWDDAERWICSPVSGNPLISPGLGDQTLLQKSKSGPIQLSNDGATNNFMVAESPFSTGVLLPPPGVSLYYNTDNRGRVSKSTRWTDLASDSSSLEDEEQDDCIKGRETILISRKDMATQMSPDRWSLRATNCSSPPINSPPKLDIREVQVDNRGTLISLADKNASFLSNRPYLNRQEAKIAAWENLHKAKAEAAIRKLEMKLEKKRASSTDAILNKLRAAQMKADNMRKSTSIISKENQSSKTYYHKVKFFLSGCVTCCHAGS